MIEVFVFICLFYFVLNGEREEGKESLTMTISFIFNLFLSTLKTRNYLGHNRMWTKRNSIKLIYSQHLEKKKNPSLLSPCHSAGS